MLQFDSHATCKALFPSESFTLTGFFFHVELQDTEQTFDLSL